MRVQGFEFKCLCAQEEVSPDQLLTSRDAYVVDWDNLSWAVNVQLGDLTGLDQYTSVITRILSVWVFGDAVQNVSTRAHTYTHTHMPARLHRIAFQC